MRGLLRLQAPEFTRSLVDKRKEGSVVSLSTVLLKTLLSLHVNVLFL